MLQAFSDSKYRMNTYFQQELADVAVCTKAKLWLAKRYVKAPHEHGVIGG